MLSRLYLTVKLLLNAAIRRVALQRVRNAVRLRLTEPPPLLLSASFVTISWIKSN